VRLDDVFAARDEPNLRVIDRLAGDDPELFDVLVVEPVNASRDPA
jgi:hypothetical protein